jgi:hypothetical protein
VLDLRREEAPIGFRRIRLRCEEALWIEFMMFLDEQSPKPAKHLPVGGPRRTHSYGRAHDRSSCSAARKKKSDRAPIGTSRSIES